MKSRDAVRWIFLVAILLLGGATAIAQTTTAPSVMEPADVAAPKLGRDGQLDSHFARMHSAYLKRRSEGPIDILFLGDSITEGWSGQGKEIWDKFYANRNAVHFGIGGDKTQHVLWRIDNGELDGISPKVVILLIGTNNVGYPAEDIIKADAKIVAEIHQKLPQTRVLVLGIFPRGPDPSIPKWAEFRAKIIEVNKGLAALEDGDKTRFLDIGDKFLTPDGKITKEFMFDDVALHPNTEGYLLWVAAMNPLLDEMMK
jgi:beta-glucosidase